MLRSKVCQGVVDCVEEQSVPSHFEVKRSKEQNDPGSKVCVSLCLIVEVDLETKHCMSRKQITIDFIKNLISILLLYCYQNLVVTNVTIFSKGYNSNTHLSFKTRLF